MNRTWLWVLAIAAVVGPWMYLNNGSANAMSGAAKMAVAVQMRQQAMLFEMQMGESFGTHTGPIDAAFLNSIVAQLNSINASSQSPAAAEQARKEGLNPNAIPKPIPWLVAPAKMPRSLSLGVVGPDLVITGWGEDLEKPLYERKIAGMGNR